MSEAAMKQIAAAIVERLFTNGAGQRAERLVLTDRNGRDLGGWADKPAQDQIVRVLRQFEIGD